MSVGQVADANGLTLVTGMGIQRLSTCYGAWARELGMALYKKRLCGGIMQLCYAAELEQHL